MRTRFAIFTSALSVLITGSASAQLNMKFVNNTGLADSDIFITFQGASSVNATYAGGSYFAPVNPGDIMTNSVSLTSIGSNGINIVNASGPVVFVSYATTINGTVLNGNLSGNSVPSYIGSGGANYNQVFQPFEITAIQGQTGGQGNLTNINYFTAPIKIQSFNSSNPNTPLQTKGYNVSTATLANTLATMTAGNSLATATYNGTILRYIGPSSYGVGANPYPTFDDYIAALSLDNQTARIVNSNAFNTQETPGAGNINYNYTLDLTASFASDRTITLSGNITTTITPYGGVSTNGTTYSGASFTISPTIGANTNNATFTNTIYGQADPLGSGNGSTTFNSVWEQLATDMAGLGLYLNDATPGTTYSTTQSLAIGEITTGLLGGFVGSNATYTGGNGNPYAGGNGTYAQFDGMAYEDVPSAAWWNTEVIPSPSTLQPDDPFYSQYSEAIFNATNNEVYSIPFSDRFGKGPLMQTQLYNGTVVDTWVVTLEAPIFMIPEPGATALIFFAGGVLFAQTTRRRRARQEN